MKIVLTGASSGIGRYLTKTLVKAHEVWGIARSESALSSLKADLGESFSFTAADVSDWDSVAGVGAEIEKAWNGIDALICCAGVVTPIGPAVQVDPRQWSDAVRINLDGTFFSIRAFFHSLKKASSRSKVLCFSGGGATGPRANFTAYASAKSGLVRLVETLSVEWANDRIDINAIAPGAIPTRMTQAVLDAGPDCAGKQEYANALAQQSEQDEAVDRVHDLIEYLLSSTADGISGKLISVRWDPWEDFAQHKDDLAGSDIYALRRIVPEDRGQSW